MKKPVSTRISVISVSHLGSQVGFLLAMRGLASEIVLSARDADQNAVESQRSAAVEALDIKHAIAFTSHRVQVHAEVIERTKESRGPP